MILESNRIRLREYFKWYEGDLTSLFSVGATPINGLELVKASEMDVKYNYFAASSNYFDDANSNDLPYSDPDATQLILDVSEHWSVSGDYCIAVSESGIKAVRPDFVHPVYNQYDRTQLDRILLVYPFVRRPGEHYPNGAQTARVIEYRVADDVAYESIRRIHGNNLFDSPLGTPVAVRVLYHDTKDGNYDKLESLVRQLIVRQNILQGYFNVTALPILQMDKDEVLGGRFRGRTATQSQLVEAARPSGLGLTIPPGFIGEQDRRYIEASGAANAEVFEYMRLLLSQMAVTASVPDWVLGTELGRPTTESERILFAGQAKVNRFRRSLESMLASIGIDMKYTTEPFVTKTMRERAVIQQFLDGIITLDEVRVALGRVPNVEVETAPRTVLNTIQSIFRGER